jgi:hypothetical protein
MYEDTLDIEEISIDEIRQLFNGNIESRRGSNSKSFPILPVRRKEPDSDNLRYIDHHIELLNELSHSNDVKLEFNLRNEGGFVTRVFSVT